MDLLFYEGKQYRESTGTDNKQFAKDGLAKRQVEIREQRFFDVKKGTKVGFEELAQDFLRYYRERGRKSLDRAGTSVKHLRGFFGNMHLTDITPEAIERHITVRLQQNTKLGKPTRPATVNRELAALSRMFTLAIRHKKADRNPVSGVERLQEHNKRDRILSPEELDQLLNASRTFLKPILMLDYYTGMRRGEILQLCWRQVDLKKGLIRLETRTPRTEKTA